MTDPTDDPHDLQRFLTAQGPVMERVLGELRAGRKTSHWMWFVFPQIAGLGRSGTARFYAIRSRAEDVISSETPGKSGPSAQSVDWRILYSLYVLGDTYNEVSLRTGLSRRDIARRGTRRGWNRIDEKKVRAIQMGNEAAQLEIRTL